MEKAIKVLAFLAVLFFCILVFSDNKADVDLWGNVGFVKTFPWNRDFQYVNTFSFVEPYHPWFNHEWLSQYILNFTHTHFGNPGLLILKLILGICVVWLIYSGMNESSRSGPVKFIWLLLVISTMGYGFSTRPHLFTYVFFALLLLYLRKYRTIRPWHLFLAPFFVVMWVNLHGAFFIGIILLSLYLVFEALKGLYLKEREYASGLSALACAIILFAAASLVNPYGVKLWSYIFYSAGITRPFLSEWAPLMRIEYLREHVDFIFLSCLSFLAIGFSFKMKDMTWAGILFISFLAAIWMRRNIPLFAITAGFIAPEYIERTAGRILDGVVGRLSKTAQAIFLSIFIVIIIWHTFTFNKTNPAEIEVPQNRFPTDIVSFIKLNGITGNALVFFDWAEYSIWKLYPDVRVFLDGRLCAAYSLKAINDYFNFLYAGENWPEALTNYPTDIVFIHKQNPAYEKMLHKHDWSLAYENEFAALFLVNNKHDRFFKMWSDGRVKQPVFKRKEYFP